MDLQRNNSSAINKHLSIKGHLCKEIKFKIYKILINHECWRNHTIIKKTWHHWKSLKEMTEMEIRPNSVTLNVVFAFSFFLSFLWLFSVFLSRTTQVFQSSMFAVRDNWKSIFSFVCESLMFILKQLIIDCFWQTQILDDLKKNPIFIIIFNALNMLKRTVISRKNILSLHCVANRLTIVVVNNVRTLAIN